jgi:hypothetical protein
MYRILLLALLPVLALALYVEGQRYDPALIDFEPARAGPARASDLFPPEISGYTLTGRARAYTRENLYEHINGHAEFFISAGFLGLSVGEYRAEGAGENRSEAVVEVYDMGTPLHAFGILTDEAGENDVEPGPAGGRSMEIRTDRRLAFTAGKYYVKINTFADAVPVDSFAASITETIVTGEAETDTTALFSRFPDLGRVVATRFIKEAYRGLGFVENVLEREYSIDGRTVHVFIAGAGERDTRRLVEKFLEYFRKNGIAFEQNEKNGVEFYKVRDPYEGDWLLVPSSDALFGVFGTDDEKIVEHLVP